MLKKILTIVIAAAIVALIVAGYIATAHHNSHHGGEASKVNPKEIIFSHLGDAYGWEVPFDHTKRIPLPVIVRSQSGSWHVFMSSRLDNGQSYEGFRIASDGDHNGKIVEDVGGEEYRPWDFSITKNVAGIFIAAIVVILVLGALRRWYVKNGMKAPRGGMGFLELIVEFVYTDTVVPILGKDSRKYGPYLLTAFFFILTMNLLGLMVIFPGGANLTGNLAVTGVLAIATFLITNITGTKHYWKDIFWPDVPVALKFPVPMMPLIEFLGILTKPLALMVRLFANMLGGHMVVIVLVLLTFIGYEMTQSAAAAGGIGVVSVLLTLFMLLLDTLISFIQAYVFTLLSTIFISMAHEGGHAEPAEVKKQ